MRGLAAYNACVDAAAACCVASNCNAPGADLKCFSEGLWAMAAVNSAAPRSARRACWAGCMAVGVTPQCISHCKTCDANTTGVYGHIQSCMFGCLISATSGPVNPMSCYRGCFAGIGIRLTYNCMVCASCMTSTFITCSSICAYP